MNAEMAAGRRRDPLRRRLHLLLALGPFRRDARCRARFRFTAIQSDYGTRLAQAFGIDPDDPDTNAVVHGGVAHFKSDAALTVL